MSRLLVLLCVFVVVVLKPLFAFSLFIFKTSFFSCNGNGNNDDDDDDDDDYDKLCLQYSVTNFCYD